MKMFISIINEYKQKWWNIYDFFIYEIYLQT